MQVSHRNCFYFTVLLVSICQRTYWKEKGWNRKRNTSFDCKPYLLSKSAKAQIRQERIPSRTYSNP